MGIFSGIKRITSKFFSRWKNKYRFVIMNESFEERLSVNLSRQNVFVIFTTSSLILIFLTTIIIAYTPLKEYIPGYASVDMQREMHRLKQKADSLDAESKQREAYLKNIQIILNDELVDNEENYKETSNKEKDAKVEVEPESLDPSVQDSIFRKEVEGQIKYFGSTINQGSKGTKIGNIDNTESLKNIFFHTPTNGFITNVYNPSKSHFGIDIATAPNQPIRAIQDGFVLVSDWTLKTGNIIVIQHANNLVSVYKHNANIMKRQGDKIKGGEIIAHVGNTGLSTTGAHLHFEMWHNGISVDPRKYISFKTKSQNSK
ncbi:MAG: M23 family metallopeptidase [Bacteroidales bacterium]|jgi:murein DD-endopeptidase MepM/ murein hydrolase activator NlpD|nr:M23 family metallopeptidase [Bacteroidales bacterium]